MKKLSQRGMLISICAVLLAFAAAACTPVATTVPTTIAPTTIAPTTAAPTTAAPTTTIATTQATTPAPRTSTAITTTTAKPTTTTTTTSRATTTTMRTTTITTTTAARSTSQPSTTPPGTTAIFVTKGSLISVDWGDYLHFQMKGDDGKDYSFFVLRKLEPDPEELKPGQRVLATWSRGKVYIPEAGDFMDLEQLIGLEVLP